MEEWHHASRARPGKRSGIGYLTTWAEYVNQGQEALRKPGMPPSMSNHLNKAAIDLFRKHIGEHYAPPDPLYTRPTDPTTGRKQKRVKRPPPPGLSKHDARVLRTVQSRAHHLDTRFSFLGLSFGYSVLLSLLLPFLGPALDALLAHLLVIRKARQARIPPWLLARMQANTLFAAAVSLVPLAGDLFLAVWKPNWRNAALLEEFLRVRGEEAIRSQKQKEKEKEAASPQQATEEPLASKKAAAGLFSLARWRRHPKPDDTPTEPTPTPIDIDTDTERTATGGPHSLPATTSTSGQGGSSSSSSVRKKTSLGVGSIFSSLGRKSGSLERAPPAGEKGRFIEHVPEANYEQRRSQVFA